MSLPGSVDKFQAAVIKGYTDTLIQTTKFNSMWPAGTPNPFVWSFDGSKGYGTHADYLFGWKGDSLQRAMNKSECFYDGCGSITKQAMTVANKCTVKDQVGENIDGCTFILNLPLFSDANSSQGSPLSLVGRSLSFKAPTEVNR